MDSIRFYRYSHDNSNTKCYQSVYITVHTYIHAQRHKQRSTVNPAIADAACEQGQKKIIITGNTTLRESFNSTSTRAATSKFTQAMLRSYGEPYIPYICSQNINIVAASTAACVTLVARTYLGICVRGPGQVYVGPVRPPFGLLFRPQVLSLQLLQLILPEAASCKYTTGSS